MITELPDWAGPLTCLFELFLTLLCKEDVHHYPMVTLRQPLTLPTESKGGNVTSYMKSSDPSIVFPWLAETNRMTSCFIIIPYPRVSSF